MLRKKDIFQNVEKERSVKRKSNLSSIRVIKNSSFNQYFLYMYISDMVKTFLKILWWRFLVPRSNCLLVSSTTLSCKTQNIVTLSMLVLIQIAFFLRSISYALLSGLFNSVIKIFIASQRNFFIFEFHCFVLLLNFITSN